MKEGIGKSLKVFFLFLLIVILTLVTQVGGIILLLSFPLFRYIDGIIKTPIKNNFLKFMGFIHIYLIATFLFVPFLAQLFGRKPLPFKGALQPLNIMTIVLNRHYVKEELFDVVNKVAKDLVEKSPNRVVYYLDANFPFINGFPLLPHLSHNDGEKLDIAFYYLDRRSGKPLLVETPSFIGYGVFENPKSSELNQPDICAKKGYWQYGLLSSFVPQGKKKEMIFDEERTKTMISGFLAEPLIKKIFIETHLKTRLNFRSPKIRYHGCQAVRHDDHIHIQL